MSYLLRTLLLGPVILIQGLTVRARVPKLPEPPGERQGRRGSGPPLSLLIIGDSAAAGVGAEHQDEALLGRLVSKLSPHYEISWDLQARTGDTTAGALARLDAMPPRHFDVVVTSLGVNDVTRMVYLGDWLRQQKQLRSVLRNKFSADRIFISGLPPMHAFPALPQPLRWHIGSRATEFNRALRADLAADADTTFLDTRFTSDTTLMSHDGFHPGPEAYAQWGQRIADAIQRS
jgi:lysophospholipase L1-like esterase